MTKDEFKTLVKGMKAAYPQPTFIPDKDAFNVWFALLQDIPYSTAQMAIQKHMMTERFPPTIADIRAGASAVAERMPEEMGELEAWSLIRKAMGNSGYHAEEEFAKLPEACQIAVGSPANLREWALMDSDQVETVEQSHFIRNYRAASKRISEDRKLPVQFRQQIAQARAEHEQLEDKRRKELEMKNQDSIPEKEPEEAKGMSEETRRKLDELLRKMGGKA